MPSANDASQKRNLKFLLEDDGDAVDYAQKSNSSRDAKKYLNARTILIELLVTFAVIVLLFSFYQAVLTNVGSSRGQQRDIESLRDSWSVSQTVDDVTSLGSANVGDAIGILQAKDMSPEEYPVYKGAFEPEILNAGPATYENASEPGELGNMSIAAHRDGWNSPFSEADKLGTCDEITLETKDKVYVYKVASTSLNQETRSAQNSDCFGQEIADTLDSDKYKHMYGSDLVRPDKVNVTWPVPGSKAPDVRPDLSIITFTTCHPHWSSDQRMIIHGVLTDVLEKEK